MHEALIPNNKLTKLMKASQIHSVDTRFVATTRLHINNFHIGVNI